MAGLILIQLYWINKTIAVEKSAITRSLNTDFEKLASDLEERTYCYTLYAKTYLNKREGIYLIKQEVDTNGKYIPPSKGGRIDTLNLFNYYVYKGDTIIENYPTLELSSFSSSLDVTFNFAIEGIMDPSRYSFKSLTSDNLVQAFDNNVNIGYVVNRDYVDKEVKRILQENGLDSQYFAGIRRQGEDAFQFVTDSTPSIDNYSTVLEAKFFEDNIGEPYVLSIGVKEPFKKIISSLSVMMITSVVIILILIISYAYFIRTIIQQRRLSDMKNAFINNITHEFRTPITNISLALENWRETKSNPDFYYDIIDEENKHLESNVDQILQLATLKHNGVKSNYATVDIHEVIKDSLAGFNMQLHNLGGKVSFLPEAVNHKVHGDKRELSNMMQNLVSNAIKYRKDKPEITIRTSEQEDNIMIEVEDNGIGMSTQAQKHIFERFYRSSTGDRHDVKGFGLGLSYAKYIVDNHNGRITVKSKEGAGSIFTIYLPKKMNHG